jgi:hypothetical protein
MSFNQFTNLDFQDLRTQIKDYLRANSNFTDFDFEGSNFSVLIDVLAYNSYVTAFNANMTVNESFLDSATLRENVVSLARNIGYVPRSRRSSKARVSFSVNTSGFLDVKAVTLKAGVVALGTVESGNYVFSIPEDITVTVDAAGYAYFNDIQLWEGTFLTKSFIVDNSQPNQKFLIPNPSVDTTSIRVYVTDLANEEYIQYTNILNVDATSKIFLVQEVEDERYELLFGDDVFGKKPTNGSSIFVSYIITNGKAGNGSANFNFSGILEDNNQNRITNGISPLTTTLASENGDDIEKIDSIKYLAPRVYSSQYRAVTANDYKGLIPFIFPNVESVTAYGGDELDPPQYGKVFISVKPRQGKFLSRISKEEIKKQLKQYSIAGIKPELVDLKYLYVELNTSVYYDRSSVSDISSLRNKVIETLSAYGKSYDLNNFGGRFKYSKVNALIDDISGSITSNITKVKMRRDMQPAYNQFATYEICFGNSFHIKKNNILDNRGYNIKSSGFGIKDVDGTVYLSDVPINETQGTIFYFTLKDNLPFIIKNNAGVVYYKKGEVLLDTVNIISSVSPNGVEIQAVPESNDVIALQDIYLELSIDNLVVNMVEDRISSGENTSATEYIVTSSYSNGAYTR